jgi:drug/metabolite transporter (DMT)-like permease
VGILLGLAAAVCWGVSDFAARFASRRVGSYRVSFFIQVIGFATLTFFLWATGNLGRLWAAHGWHGWAWAVLAGALNAVCSVLFYHSLEVGVLAVVAPISASYPALTVTLAILSGERFSVWRGAGIASTFLGVVLTATSPMPEKNAPGERESGGKKRHVLSQGVGWAILASLSFGVLFWVLGFRAVPAIGGLASVWVIRLVTGATLGMVALPARQSIRLPRGTVWWLLATVGVLDTSAFLANNFALQWGPVSVVTVLASLFSAITVLLACVFLRERLARVQWVGIALILAGVALVNWP